MSDIIVEEKFKPFLDKIVVGKLNFIGYCRVSTMKQKEEENIDVQIDVIKKYINLHNDKLNLIGICIDDGVSGSKDRDERSGFDEAMTLLEMGFVDGLIARDLSRIARKTRILTRVLDKLQENKKELILVKQNIDTSTPAGRAFYGIMAIFVQWDLENTVERLKEGRAYAKEHKDVIFGRRKKPIPEYLQKRMIFWYKNQKHGVLKISKLILAEEMKDYPKWFQRQFSDGFGKPLNKEEKKFYLSPATVRSLLKEWKVKMREPKYRNNKEESKIE